MQTKAYKQNRDFSVRQFSKKTRDILIFMQESTNQTPTPRTAARVECDKALHCLYVAVDESVARSINEKVYAHINAIDREISEAKQELAAIQTGIQKEFYLGESSSDVLQDFGMFIDHHNKVESSLQQLRQVADGLAKIVKDKVDGGECFCGYNQEEGTYNKPCEWCLDSNALTAYHNLNKPQEKRER